MITLLSNRRGIALPIALFGLVAVALLITTGILTSATGTGISGAQRGSAIAFYEADGALATLLTQAQAAGGFTGEQLAAPFTIEYGTAGAAATMRVQRIFEHTEAILTTSPPGTLTNRTYSISARQAGGVGGRQLVTLVHETYAELPAEFELTAGATAGGNFWIHGNKARVSNKSSLGCEDPDGNEIVGENAIQLTIGGTLRLSGGAGAGQVDGNIENETIEKEDLERHVLHGMTLSEFAAKYASLRLNRSHFQGSSAENIHSRHLLTGPDSLFNWGCPTRMIDGCENSPHLNRMPTVAVDAQGGTIKLNREYGQGALLVLNGSLELGGNFNFKGVIMVDKNIKVMATGGGQQEGKIEGAVVAFGNESKIEETVGETGGAARIHFNQCVLDSVKKAMAENAPANVPTFSNTFNWFEVVR